MTARSIAVVGAGWAGLAAAVRATERGHRVTVIELAAVPGGRARTVESDDFSLDNGQHILIGAYARTLDLMQTVGADIPSLLRRMPLTLRYPDGRGLTMPPGPPALGFARAVFGCDGWTWRDRMTLLAAAIGWAVRGFRCDPTWTAERLCRGLPFAVRELLIDPLCIAALNTPASEASAAVLLRVLHDALFGSRGSADLLLPRRPLGELLPQPALLWLARKGVAVHLGRRVQRLTRMADGWALDDDGTRYDAVVLACPVAEAARLIAPIEPDWSAQTTALRYEPIVTVYLQAPNSRLATPMMALVANEFEPAQFAFDHGALGGRAGLFAFVVSGAARWVERGLADCAEAVRRQSLALLKAPRLVRVLAEKRATFRCTPGLLRPPATIAPGLFAAGDYVAGPYPSTLEGAVRAGEAAASLAGA